MAARARQLGVTALAALLSLILASVQARTLTAWDDGPMHSSPHGRGPRIAASNATFFFMHVPKCGGTTFRYYLKDLAVRVDKPFCEFWTESETKGPPTNPTVKLSDGSRIPCKIFHIEGGFTVLDQAIAYLSGPGYPVEGITMLRSPMEAVVSAIGHGVMRGRHGVEDKLEPFLNGTCPGEGCESPGYNILNRQAQWLAQDTELLLTELMGRLEKILFVGITEFMPASECLFEYQIGKFNRTKCDFTGQCKLGDLGTVENAASGKALNPLNSFTYEELTAMQRLIKMDLVLYHHAMSIFLSRVRYVEREQNVKLLCFWDVPVGNPGDYWVP